MTKPLSNAQLRFFLTSPTPCAYLPGRSERKVFTALEGADAAAIGDTLAQFGFRRSQTIAYRPACEGCDACVSVRIPAQAFVFSRRWRKVLARNADLVAQAAAPIATHEQFALFDRYLRARHEGGGMAGMRAIDYASMVEDSAARTRLVEYRTAAGVLIAAALVDVLSDGVSLVYSFYDPGLGDRSLGSFVVLDHVRRVREAGLGYVYLGYWVRGSEKMEYKAGFRPLEVLRRGGWRAFDERDAQGLADDAGGPDAAALLGFAPGANPRGEGAARKGAKRWTAGR